MIPVFYRAKTFHAFDLAAAVTDSVAAQQQNEESHSPRMTVLSVTELN
jgi:hypothetical protein